MTRKWRALLIPLFAVSISGFAQLQMFEPCRSDPNDWESAWWIHPNPDLPLVAEHRPPVDGEYGQFLAAAVDARDQVKHYFDAGWLAYRLPPPEWDKIPHVKWLASDFWVGVGFDGSRPWTEQLNSGGICAAGLTDAYLGFDGQWHRQIVISYRLSDRVAALVRWESVNYWLGMTGRTDWQDRFAFTDRGALLIPPDTLPGRRRAAGP